MKPKHNIIKSTLMAFSTPIFHTVIEDTAQFNTDLSRIILEWRQKSPKGVKYSNQGGWHSEANFLQEIGEPYRTRLSAMFMKGVSSNLEVMIEPEEPLPARILVTAWANINERGDSNSSHCHPGCPWSGVYYVSTDVGPEVGGNLVFVDPRAAAVMIKHPYNPFSPTATITVIPKPGLLVVFPSFVYHFVSPYHSDIPRITVAFNMH